MTDRSKFSEMGEKIKAKMIAKKCFKIMDEKSASLVIAITRDDKTVFYTDPEDLEVKAMDKIILSTKGIGI